MAGVVGVGLVTSGAMGHGGMVVIGRPGGLAFGGMGRMRVRLGRGRHAAAMHGMLARLAAQGCIGLRLVFVWRRGGLWLFWLRLLCVNG